MKKLFLLFFLAPIVLLSQQKGFWNDKRAQIELANFLDTQMITGYNFESDVTFPLAMGKFPDLEVSSPLAVKHFMGGDYAIQTRWFDTHLKEVKKPELPGRYGYYSEVRGANGKVMRRAGTMFCNPKDWMGWSEEVLAQVSYFPFDDIENNVWKENERAIASFSGQMLLESILNQKDGAILMSYIHDMDKKGLKPGPLNTPLIMDGEYHIQLKRKVLGKEDFFESLTEPRKTTTETVTLVPLPAEESSTYAVLQKELESLCINWAQESGEPFDMMIAKEGKILFHGAFGKNLRGSYGIDTPTEIASITKLFTGLLFAQFMDQGLINLDDPVGKYLPDFDLEGQRAITLRQCFTHTTGLVGHGSMGGVQNPWLDNSLVHWLPHIEVGTYHWYNGMGYNLAGKVMEMVSGKSIFRLMHEQLFAPLGLEHSYNDVDLAYGIRSTAYDLAIVGQMLLNKGAYGDTHFFSEEVYEQLLPTDLEPYFPKIKGKTWGIGLTQMNSFEKDKETGKRRAIFTDQFIGHGSATSSILRVDPKHKVVITQSRMDAGREYQTYVKRLLNLLEKHLGQ